MAQNPLPKPFGELMVLAGKCVGGLVTYGVPLGITQLTPATLQADIDALGLGVTAFNASRAARTAASATLNAASADAKAFLSTARGVLAPVFGEHFNTQWVQAGWTDNSTAIPDTQPGRLALCRSLQGFLTANPGYEVSAGPVVFTAARAGMVAGAFQAALNGIDAADTDSDQKKAVRADADRTLRGDLRMLIGILNLKLTPTTRAGTRSG